MLKKSLLRTIRAQLLAGAAIIVTGIAPSLADDAPAADQTQTAPVAAPATAPAAAPAAEAAPAPAPDVEKVTVTGSRIKQKNLQTVSPVTQVSGADVDRQGVTRVEDLVNQLPQVFSSQGSNISNGATGTATVNLRGLGSVRNLVLVNGRRMGYGSPLDPSPDLNQIPAQLIDRVEVYTGGASGVYGSDAISGVVNFIMRKNFEGVQFDAQYGFYQHNNDYDGPGNLRQVIADRALTNPSQFQLPRGDVNDGFSKDLTGVMGVNTADGRGNIMAYMGYRSNDAVLQSQRDYSACALDTGLNGSDFACGGSATSYPGLFSDFANFGYGIDKTTGLARDFDDTTDLYNYGPLNYFQRPDERYSLGAFGHYEVSPAFDVYSEIMVTDYRTVAQIAPSGTFFETETINCGNPLLNGLANGAVGGGAFSVEQLDTMGCNQAAIDADTVVPMFIGRRNVEGGGRQDDLHYESYRMVGGVRGEIAPGWDYDLSLVYSKVQLSEIYKNDLSISRMTKALDVVDADAGAGVDPQCRSAVAGTDPDCVPFNVFELDGVTPEALAYLSIPLIQTGSTTQREGTFVLNADLGTFGVVSPWAETPVQAVLGVDWRRDELESAVDTAFATGDGAGQGGPTIAFPSAAVDLTEYFGEVEAFILEDKPWAKQVKLHASYRYSEYDYGFTANTYGIGGDWSPVKDFRFRGSFQHASRGPNVLDLFASQGQTLFDMDDDPCDATDPAENGYAGDAACVGVNPWQVTLAQTTNGSLSSPAGQYQQLSGGNPNLAGESADTITLGAVFTPTFVKNLILSVDWYRIQTQDFITSLGGDTTVDECFNNGNTALCGLITRGSTGSLWFGSGQVQDINQNLNPGIKTSGVDVVSSYRLNLDEMDAGELQFDMVGTYIIKWDAGGLSAGINCAGYYNCGNEVTPEWRHRLRTTWVSPFDAEFSVTWRYRGAVVNPDGATDAPDYELEAKDYFDVAATFDLPLNTRLRMGVENVFDNDPPLTRFSNGFGNGNTFPQYYDSMGRWAFMGISVDM